MSEDNELLGNKMLEIFKERIKEKENVSGEVNEVVSSLAEEPDFGGREQIVKCLKEAKRINED
ncbi:hypothetical protein [Methanonatronarchaeum sp. AMET-Sl]|uniref:hypothetical protein n=1 Tax=Methanonatronarchaeum sp. AMET-Sl TaxID=3037654 RepID=UPI00244E17C2|nr:hypothetical protein [Methanonatronarchaeum sp. AMET-Sl]WGI17887.1 hypothetical protein QEN48_02455 [Methanonatronarchaeum sp. AMET-Sl]